MLCHTVHVKWLDLILWSANNLAHNGFHKWHINCEESFPLNSHVNESGQLAMQLQVRTACRIVADVSFCNGHDGFTIYKFWFGDQEINYDLD